MPRDLYFLIICHWIIKVPSLNCSFYSCRNLLNDSLGSLEVFEVDSLLSRPLALLRLQLPQHLLALISEFLLDNDLARNCLEPAHRFP